MTGEWSFCAVKMPFWTDIFHWPAIILRAEGSPYGPNMGHQGSPWTGVSVLSSTATVLLTILNLWLIICNNLLIYQAHQGWFFVPWVNANQSQASCRWELCRTMAAKPRKLFETVAVLNCVTRGECTMYKSGLHRFSAGEKINTCPLPIK